VSGADYPRRTEYFRDAVIAARSVIERETTMRAPEADRLAEAIAERLLGDFLAVAEESAWVALTPDGTGPVCTWCGALAGPRIPPGHPQYGVFCTCRRPKDEHPGDGDVLGLAKAAEVPRA
jgi:hypothetical protein